MSTTINRVGEPAARERRGSGVREPGTVLGSYRLLGLLGEGGMGVVYLAEHTRLGRKVALKTLRGEYSQNPLSVKRFFGEARAVNRISHHNIVEITDFIEQPGGDNYYIMELLHGELLSDVIDRGPAPSLERSVRVMVQVASALEAVHDGGIIHRDLKPENIYLVTRAGQRDFVKILDFGVAQLLELGDELEPNKTGATTIVGTPEYMSPEQAAGQAFDHRTDIYAFGIMLYELLTGRVPFEADSFGEIVVKHMTEAPVPPSQISGLPHTIVPALEEVVLDCLAKDPAKRPASMDAIQNRLIAIAEEEGWELVSYADVRLSGRHRLATGSAPPPVQTGPVEKVAGARSRAPIVATALAGVAIAAGAGIWFATRPDPAPAPPAVVVPAPPAAPVPAPPPVAAPERVEIDFRTSPAGAGVYRAGTSDLLGVTPWTMTATREDRAESFEVRLAGYEPATEQVSLARSALVSLRLVAIAAPPSAATPAEPVRPRSKGRAPKKHPAPGTGSAAPAYTPEERDGVLDPLAGD